MTRRGGAGLDKYRSAEETEERTSIGEESQKVDRGRAKTETDWRMEQSLHPAVG